MEGIGWITSSSAFAARIGPKHSTSGNELKQPEMPEPFLFGSVYCTPATGITVESKRYMVNYTPPTSADFYNQASTGIDIRATDRLFEEATGCEYLVRTIAAYRDQRAPHEEISIAENALKDKSFVEPILIKDPNFPNATFNELYQEEYERAEGDYTVTSTAYGIIMPPTLSEEKQLLMIAKEGKIRNEDYIVYVDADAEINDNTILHLRGEDYEIQYIVESLYRILKVGVCLYKVEGTFKQGFSDNTINRMI